MANEFVIQNGLISNSNVVVSGSVGIGTNNPEDDLEINAINDAGIILDGSSSSTIRMKRSGGNQVTIQNSSASTEGLYISSPASMPITLNPAGSTAMFLKSDGNVGIGTTSPDTVLHVLGAPSTDGSLNYELTVTDTTSMAEGVGGGIRFEGDYTVAGGGIISACGISAGKDNSTGGGTAFSMLFHVRPSAGSITEKMRIASSGNVGIGTTSPDDLLHLYRGNSAATAYSDANQLIIEDDVNTGLSIMTPDNRSGNIAFSTPTDADVALIYAAYNAGSQFLRFSAGGSAIMYLKGGNVGIGTDTPDGKLHVHDGSAGSVSASAGSVAVLESNSTSLLQFLTPNINISGLIFGDADANGIGQLTYNHNGDYMQFKINAADAMRIDSSGNVGIGTTSPVRPLHVGGDSMFGNANATGEPTSVHAEATTADIVVLYGGNQTTGRGGSLSLGGTYVTGDPTSQTVFGTIIGGKTNATTTNESGYLSFLTNNAGTISEAMRIDSSGNVGIGTTNPTTKLHVEGGITETGGVLKQNLLTNSGFGVWSNSGGLYSAVDGSVPAVDDANSLTPNGDMETGSGDPWIPTGWVNFNADAGEITNPGGNTLQINVDANGEGVITNDFIVEKGKLYLFTCSITYTAGTLVVSVQAGDGTTPITAIDVTATNTTFSYLYEETVGGSSAKIYFTSSVSMNVIVDSVKVHEVTPGCVANDSYAMDGWYKSSAGTIPSLLREHDGSNTKDGSFYALKMVGTSNSEHSSARWPAAALTTSAEHYRKFAGRTITVGVWVKTDTASNTRIRTSDGSSWESSAYHTGGGTVEWLEVTRTLGTGISSFIVAFSCEVDTKISYISQPMLVFGNSIGEGNYAPIPQETIWFEDDVNIAETSTPLAADDKTLNVEALSNSKIPKNVAALYAQVDVQDSAVSNGTGPGFFIDSTTNTPTMRLFPQVNNMRITWAGWLTTGSTGDIYQRITTAGDTLSSYNVLITGVQLR